MKKKFISSFLIIVFLNLAAMISSCKKYLDQQSTTSFSTSAAFGSVTNATNALIGVYSKLAGANAYGLRLSEYFMVDADDMLGPPSNASPDGERRDIARYGATPANSAIEPVFENLYSGIELANICIKNIPLMPQYTSGSASDQTAVKRLYGEALTLRAQFYFELIKNWGDVPAQFIPSADEPTLVIGRTDRDVIYAQILNDLKTAEDLVPWRTEVTRDERITKGAVKGIRARLALFRGGWSLRNASGQMERRTDYLDYYKIAYSECSDLMARRDQHTLNTSNNNGFQTLFLNYVDAHTPDPTGEIMFEAAMGGANANSDSQISYYDGPRVNSFGLGAILGTPTYFYDFDPNDNRRDVTLAPYITNADGTKVMQKITNVTLGKFRRDWITNPSISTTSTASFFGINWPILRFSDVLLMFAEADNEINGAPSAAAIAALKEVRTRAFSNNAALIGTIATDKDGFFKAVVNERELEFGGEGIRKFDLIRWNLLGANLLDTRNRLTLMINHVAPYANLPTSTYYLNNSQTLVVSNSYYSPTPGQPAGNYTKVQWTTGLTTTFIANVGGLFKANHSELLPIPTPSIQANLLLTQNPGY